MSKWNVRRNGATILWTPYRREALMKLMADHQARRDGIAWTGLYLIFVAFLCGLAIIVGPRVSFDIGPSVITAIVIIPVITIITLINVALSYRDEYRDAFDADLIRGIDKATPIDVNLTNAELWDFAAPVTAATNSMESIHDS